MSVTRLTSHFEIFPLKDEAPRNPPPKDESSELLKPDIIVTRLTSQSGMRPNFVVKKPYSEHNPRTGSSAKQFLTAFENEESDNAESRFAHDAEGPSCVVVHIKLD